jgi:hypothetical protein
MIRLPFDGANSIGALVLGRGMAFPSSWPSVHPAPYFSDSKGGYCPFRKKASYRVEFLYHKTSSPLRFSRPRRDPLNVMDGEMAQR